MARVTIRPSNGDALSKIARSDALAEQLETIARPVMDAAMTDPNPTYVESLRMRRFYTRGKRGRVSIQIGAAPIIGSRVEAKRGTLSRALGSSGL